MPIYMDRHDIPGVTARNVAEAHRKDLEIQEDFGCSCMTYWVDEDRGNVFCLINAPDITAVKELHNKAHGLIPHGIVEVDTHVVEAFLGRIHDSVAPEGGNATEDSTFNDPAFRAILVIDLKESSLFECKYGKDIRNELFKIYHHKVLQIVQNYKGNVVEQHEEFLVSFNSVTNAVDCAIQLQEKVKKENLHDQVPEFVLQIGISAGIPVTGNISLFGDAVKVAKSLSFIANANKIFTTSIIRELYKGETPDYFDNSKHIRTLTTNEENFLNCLNNVIDSSLPDRKIKIDQFCREIGVSTSQLYRKSIRLTGLSPNDFVKEVKLGKAIKLMQLGNKSIADTSYLSGFSDPSYFSKCFKKKYNILPAALYKSIF